MKNEFFLLIIFFFSLFHQTLEIKQIMIYEGDSFDTALQNSIEERKKLFVIFYINHCSYCAHSIKVLKEQVIKNYEDEDEIEFGSVNLDKQSNVWLGVRFNITKIPFIILIENKRMYKYPEQLFEESYVLNFINDEKNFEDSFDIPESVEWGTKLKIVLIEFTQKINENMQSILDKYKIGIQWNNTMTYILLALILIIFIFLESKLLMFIKYMCKFDKFGDIKIDENGNELKEDKNKNSEGKNIKGKEGKKQKKHKIE
jgi:thioredoxin-related protein